MIAGVLLCRFALGVRDSSRGAQRCPPVLGSGPFFPSEPFVRCDLFAVK